MPHDDMAAALMRGGQRPATINCDVPLFIRLLEFAREDAKDDLILHHIAERATELSGNGKSLTMQDYEKLVKGQTGL